MRKKKGDRPRIYFFTPFCLLRNTTNRIFDMRMCSAMAGAGARVTIVFPFMYLKENLPKKELHRYYGMKPDFSVRMLPTPLTEKFPVAVIWLVLQSAFFLATLRILVSHPGNLKNVVIVSRDIPCVLPALLLKKIFGRWLPVRIVPQLHELKDEPLKSFGYRAASGLMVNVPKAKEDIIKKYGIAGEKIIVMNAPMVDFSKTDCSRHEAREKIHYNRAIPLVVYSGKISRRARELMYILDAAALLPDYCFMFTGGKESNIQKLRQHVRTKNLQNVVFTGFLNETSAVRYCQLAADVLVSYYTAADHLVDYNYPQKLQEYLSTRNPVVTPLFEATRDVINENNVFAVAPDDPQALAAGIRQAVENKELASAKALAAFEASRKVTYDYKVGEFMRFFESPGIK